MNARFRKIGLSDINRVVNEVYGSKAATLMPTDQQQHQSAMPMQQKLALAVLFVQVRRNCRTKDIAVSKVLPFSSFFRGDLFPRCSIHS